MPVRRKIFLTMQTHPDTLQQTLETKTSMSPTPQQRCTIALCYLVAMADNNMSEKERSTAESMCRMEGIGPGCFQDECSRISISSEPIRELVTALKKLTHAQQVNAVAWATTVANCDGFMSREEFSILYQIYHTELKLDQKEVLERQKEINKRLYGSSFTSLGIRVNH